MSSSTAGKIRHARADDNINPAYHQQPSIRLLRTSLMETLSEHKAEPLSRNIAKHTVQLVESRGTHNAEQLPP